MPQLKQPLSLYQQCKTIVNSMILDTCRLIEQQYGTYDDIICQTVVTNFQQYLLSNIPGHILDELCNNIVIQGVISVKPNAQCGNTHNVDSRILLSVYLHNNMRKFSVSIRLPNDDLFWIKKLYNFHKIITLDLRMTCTDEILEVVGKNCRLLEEINILSKSESCETGDKALNALKLKYFISDNGLRHLCHCKNLKKVVMNKMLRTQCAGRMMTHDGIKDVIKSLPKLQYISYTDVGMIVDTLVDEIDELALTHINDCHSKSSHIRSISKLCPNLQELCLSQPMSSTDRNVASDIVQTLTHSNLKLSVLELTFFPLEKSFEDFLKVKGVYLTSLSLWSTEPVSSNELILLGRFCPNIENVHLKELTPNISDLENLHLAEKQPMLTFLRCLYLSGRSWLPHIIIPLCLRYATQLTNLCLVNNEYTDIMDDTVNKILKVNPLINLKYVYLFSGCLISFETIVKLVSVCPNLMHLTAWKHAGLDPEDVSNLMLEMQSKNMNIELMCSSYTL
ncbi:uncharacterized protein LOC142329411 [Lycorma delicatula]|uniref:uncharacterized protein LOC142329411 n=1 Tax=Lycorma delicatula TaxID=130591 RepID=UPI003F50EF17